MGVVVVVCVLFVVVFVAFVVLFVVVGVFVAVLCVCFVVVVVGGGGGGGGGGDGMCECGWVGAFVRACVFACLRACVRVCAFFLGGGSADFIYDRKRTDTSRTETRHAHLTQRERIICSHTVYQWMRGGLFVPVLGATGVGGS